MTEVYPKEIQLNAQQKEAVAHGDGPLLIIAGAGTGKTTVVTERIKHLVSSGRAALHEILALTFTDKAATEMEERVDIAMPYGYTNIWISTFHAFCDRVLRQDGIHIGINPAYRLMTHADATLLLRNHIFSLDLDYFRPLGNPTKFISGILQHFSRLADEDVTPEQYIEYAKKQKVQSPKSKVEEEELEIQKINELARAYKKYQELKIKDGVMDFGDLITNTLALFRKRKNILSQYQKQFRYILVDEFQDTNIAQNELVTLLAGDKQNITAVCDDDQAVYKFRGASVSNVLAFRTHYPKTKLVVLSQNYRSTQAILDCSYRLIQHNNPDRLEAKEGINKQLTSVRGITGKPVSVISEKQVEDEGEAVAREILAVKGRKYQWKDFAILVRANNHAQTFVRAFMRHSIPFQFLGPGQLFRQPEVKDLIAYLNVLSDIGDSVSLLRVLSMEYFGISPRYIATVASYAKRTNATLFEACEAVCRIRPVEGAPVLPQKDTKAIRTIIDLFTKHLGLLTKESAGQILFYFLSESGLMKAVLEHTAPVDEEMAANMASFFIRLKRYEMEHEDASVSAVLDWILLSMELGESPRIGDVDLSQQNAVHILTVHSAKGLEFPVVFLTNMVSQRFPTRERREQIPIPDELIKEELPVGDYHLEEERRLCYVGMTRARDLLYFTAADYYGQAKREKTISPFVAEALGEYSARDPIARTDQMSLLEWKTNAKKTKTQVQAPTVTYLSYSQIETFRLCPLHYKLRYVLGIPTAPSASLSFGVSIHAALRAFYQLSMEGKRPDKSDLQTCLTKHWVREGYDSKAYEREMLARGVRYLDSYYTKGYDRNVQTLLLEQPFTVPIAFGSKAIKIGGRIDRVDRLPDGRLEIIDYKTGRIPSKREIDASLQLSMYAIAATHIPTPPFARNVEDVVLTLYFLDGQESGEYRITTTRTKKQLEQEKKTILEIADQIQSSDFRCSGNMLCKTCEYHMFCDAG